MKRILITALIAVLITTFIGLAGVPAKRLDKASPLSSQNATSEESLKVDTAGHADYVKSQDNSTANSPKERKD